MPELPDLEVLKGKLKEKILGRTIKKVSVKRPAIIGMAQEVSM